MRVLILGAGGHAQVIADILLRAHELMGGARPIGYLDDNPALHGQRRLGLPVFGPLAQLNTVEHDAVIVAIGHNPTRCALYRQLEQAEESFATACHPNAMIAPDVVVGPGTVVCAGVVVNPGSRVGVNIILNTGCTVDHHNQIGDHAHIAPGAHLGGDVQVGEGSLVGIGATVMPQRQVGAWSIVGAGALVYTNVPKQVTVIGIPAHILQPYLRRVQIRDDKTRLTHRDVVANRESRLKS